MQRLAQGGRIDRTRPVAFTFDGRPLSGYAGDTLASALLANDIALVGRSFKYHRPRGVMTAGAEEPNALVRLGAGALAEPNVRATRIELHDGLVAATQNCWPSARHDLRAVTDLLHALVPAGFYYKTFLWPRWSAYEGAIRRSAGLGVAPRVRDAASYTTRYAHCDVLVIGGGPAGLQAAEMAVASGGRVILVDDEPELGGALLWRAAADDTALLALPSRVAALRAQPSVEVLTRTSAAGCYDHNFVILHERLVDHLGPAAPAGAPRHRLWQVRARRVIVAAGAIERPLAFPDNDRPGIMLADAVLHYLRRYAVRAGDRAAVFANNDGAYATAFALADAGVDVAAFIDVRPAVSAALSGALRGRGIPLFAGSAVVATHGRHRLQRIRVARLDGKRTDHVACDLLAVSGGFAPNVHLWSQAGASCASMTSKAASVPPRLCRRSGASAPRTARRRFRCSVAPFWRVPAELGRGRQWIDFQNDVTVDDVALAARENFVSVEHMKRYTTAGMATDQGKTSNVNALAILAEETQRAIAAVGTTTFRPPYVPVTLGAIAGRHIRELYRPRRFTPAHACHVRAGATFAEYGGWQRPETYPRAGEDFDAAAAREVQAVRQRVGLFDGSPLGKIEIAGPDAERLLDHLFVTRIEGMAIGRIRYGVIAAEHGVVHDDGVVMRFAADRYWLGASSAHAAQIAMSIDEWLQCEWREWRVTVADATRQWAALALAGPAARAVLATAGTDIDLATTAFPHMSMREGRVAGLPARVARVSFSGELQYEINVPAGHAITLWERLLASGADSGITPIGMEAWLRLRIEKGYPVVGIDTDGTTLPEDLAPSAWRNKRANFIGRRSLLRPHALRGDRPQLVGLEAVEAAVRLPVGAHILPSADARPPCATLGRITSSAVSAALGKSVALALLANGRARVGETLCAFFDGRRYGARVVALPFYDPQGARLDV